MAQRRPFRAARASDTLVFHDHQRPALRSDHIYEIGIDQSLKVRDGQELAANNTLRLKVGGPQLVLPKGSVVSTFPADTSSGRFYVVLPHVTLSRGTLPWERAPTVGGRKAPPNDVKPWMILLILDEDEIDPARAVTGKKANKLDATIPHGDADPDADVSLLTLDTATISSLFPPLADLPWLAHTRHIEPGGETAETATVVAARLPTPGKLNHAFLLSVEHRYATAGATPPVTGTTFPILHRWSFYCEDEPRHGFAELLTRDGVTGKTVVPAPFALADGPSEAARHLATGLIPIEHHLRNGEKTAAWYHGPLLPGEVPAEADLIESRLPADHADDLMLLDREFGMFDVSYASAWELGRMIVLEHTDIAMELAAWKRGFGHEQHRAAAGGPAQALHRAAAPAALPHLPDHLAEWIRTALLELREVPFVNLVPDEALLPEGALRFFDVDPLWLEALRDGALSVGRIDGRARALDKALRAHLDHPRPMSGFLLRNGVVSDFPDLEFDAYTGTGPQAGSFDGSAVTPIRVEKLSKSLLLALFPGRIQTVDLHLHPQAIHFGFELNRPGGVETFTKSGKISGISVNQGMTDKRRVDMDALAKGLPLTQQMGSGGVAEFAIEMLENAPLVRFHRVLGG